MLSTNNILDVTPNLKIGSHLTVYLEYLSSAIGTEKLYAFKN